MGDPSTWPKYDGPKVIANWTLRHMIKGRLKSTRYLNEMDSWDMQAPCWCTLCGREGHNRSRCRQRASLCSAEGEPSLPIVNMHDPQKHSHPDHWLNHPHKSQKYQHPDY
ncbi:hypothetical protein Ahy_A09g044541 isoform B [Arachis hypogaea]|uniref:CCHC-type domain-containing protein n=1 Tax=Arachis hypogaea TaxID=3818 RepID=A0A445BKA3_ARAHY|nr:hypothetical protein Ahy_A09g044541 isoform B [Arachis hypogaea]